MTDPSAGPPSQPVPQGRYVPAVRHADLIYTSGMTPREAGELKFFGPIRVSDALEDHRAAVELATTNALVAAEHHVAEGERIVRVLQLQVFLQAEPGFTAHAALANFASDLIAERLGAAAIGSRAAIGVSTLPGNAPVEVALVAAVADAARNVDVAASMR